MINNTQDIDRTITTKFIEPLEKSCKNSVKRLKTSKVKHIESIRLITQAYKTIKNSEKNLNNYNFVDSYTLLRASLEYIVMSYMIEVEEKTYNEFLILSNNDIKLERKYTVINTLLQKFRKRLNQISNNLFANTTVKQREKIIGLSLFLSIIKLVKLIQVNNIKFDKMKQFFYYDTINSEFYMYYKVELEKIRKEISGSIVEFKTKENEINQILDEFMKFQ